MTAPTLPTEPVYAELDQLDPCELPPLLITDPVTGRRKVPLPGSTWTCEHGTTWVAVPVGIRGGVPQVVWIIRPPGPAPDEPTTTTA